MKKINVLLLFSLIVVLQGCWDSELFPGDGEVSPVTLQVVVTDAATGNAVSGATVELYHTAAGYINETGAGAVKTTDANGAVAFSRDELGEAGAKYLNVIAGAKRNWSSVSSTPVMNMTAGTTVVKTQVADVHPSFLALTANDWVFDGYTNADVAPACNNDDVFRFLKTGRVIRFDAGASCNPSREATAEGTDWSPWQLNEDATGLTVRDPDPWYFNNGYTTQSASNTYEGDFTIDPGTSVTVAFGAAYVWTLVAAP